MKNRKGLRFALLPLAITICLYVVFYSKIETKPSDAGFWLIFALGASVGVALTRFFQWSDTKGNE
jgi:hypothetical protein